MSIRAIIFDVGGVLIHEKNQNHRRKWEDRLNLPAGELRKIVFGTQAAARAAYGETLEDDVWRQVGAELGLAENSVAELRRDFWLDEELDTELVKYIQDLRAAYKIGIITNAWSDARSLHNSRFKMNTWTDVAIYSAEAKLVKPDARIYHLALSQLGVPADECVFVDDVLANVQAAAALGMKGVQYKDTLQVLNDIRNCLDRG